LLSSLVMLRWVPRVPYKICDSNLQLIEAANLHKYARRARCSAPRARCSGAARSNWGVRAGTKFLK
jgi:hypothetical protein